LKDLSGISALQYIIKANLSRMVINRTIGARNLPRSILQIVIFPRPDLSKMLSIAIDEKLSVYHSGLYGIGDRKLVVLIKGLKQSMRINTPLAQRGCRHSDTRVGILLTSRKAPTISAVF